MKMVILLRYLIVLLSIIPQYLNANVPKLPHCAEKNTNGLILVNTLDGKLSVLNHETGKEIWQMNTGPGPMLASNIDRLELTNNGHWVRIIPSLAGNLYKFNGDTIDSIPLTADHLLTASFQYSDDLVIVGGKEIRTYGVTLSSGQLIYECSLSGCVNKTKNNNYEDFILVERNTQIVRAVESRLGAERWNFSVGQMSIKLPQLSCRSEANNKFTFNLKPVVSEGLIYSMGDSQKISWKQKFDTPIVNIWTWDGHSLKPVNLFTNTQYSWGVVNVNSNISPALYVGMHNKQLYVQESEIMQRFLSDTKQGNSGDITEIKSISQIPWKPFPATSSALTVVDQKKTITNEIDDDIPTEIATTALSVLYASEYINGNGFYLYPNEPVNEDCGNKTILSLEELELEEPETPIQVIIISLWYWWKEVAVIAITTAFVVNLFITQRFYKKYPPRNEYIVVERHVPINDPFNRTNSESSDKEFTSRYVTDFTPIQCLGKGGFGIVFEAQNKIDDCNYAVKRITLPNKQESRDRVMREVKTLAKLEHKNIVRYFNAWLETPPPEWISNFDEEWKRDVLSTDGYDYTSATTATPFKRQNSSVVINITPNNSNKLYSDSDLRHKDNGDSDSFIVFESDTNKENTKTMEEKETKSYDNNSAITEMTQTFDLLGNSSKSNNNLQITPSTTVFLYIQMQLCRKESLKDWLKDNITRNSEHIRIMFSQIVAAVEYVHNNGLIHRDLKPSNIFFSKDGQIKIGDFGLVTENEECCIDLDDYTGVEDNLLGFNHDLSLDKCRNVLGKHTKAVGTQLYMSPEQLKGLSYNHKVDIYSLGVIFFEMLVPFGTTMERNKTLLDLRNDTFPDKFCQDFQKEHELVAQMLSESPDERPNSTEILSRLPIFDLEDLASDR